MTTRSAKFPAFREPLSLMPRILAGLSENAEAMRDRVRHRLSSFPLLNMSAAVSTTARDCCMDGNRTDISGTEPLLAQEMRSVVRTDRVDHPFGQTLAESLTVSGALDRGIALDPAFKPVVVLVAEPKIIR